MKPVLRYLFIISVSSILLVFSVVAISFIIYLIFINLAEDDMYPKKISQSYKSLHWNPTTEKSSYGMVKSFQNLEGDDFLRYDDVEGQTLISNFGIDDYRCTGSCYCDEESNRRTTTTIVSRGLMTLLASFSSVLAISKAKEYFTQECKDQYSSGACRSESITADVDECENVTEEAEKASEVVEEEEEVEEGGQKKKEEIQYWCEGNCLQSDAYIQTHPKGKAAEELSEEELEAFRNGMVEDFTEKCAEIKLKTAVTVHGAETSPEEIFIEFSLAPLCNQEGAKFHIANIENIFDIMIAEGDRKAYKQKKETLSHFSRIGSKEISQCSASNTPELTDNPSVVCIKHIAEF